MPRTLACLVALLLAAAPAAQAAPQNDAESGGDAGNTFEAATPVTPQGRYVGRLDRAGGDGDDFYRFFLAEGAFVSVLVSTPGSTDPVMILDPSGIPVDVGAKVGSLGVSAGGTFTSEVGQIRVAVHRAHVAGEYRLHLRASTFNLTDYSLCFANCDEVVDAPQDFIFGGSLPRTRTRVLLVPPSHGDLGNPLGPTLADYLAATLRGIHRWTAAMGEFATDFPRYSYLRDITVEIEIFDGADPVEPAGYEVVVGYVAAGPVFRGVAADFDQGGTQEFLDSIGLGDRVHYTGRTIALSLFGSSPRAGQVLYDFPEVDDLEIVTLHEFGHTFGLGHTRTWHPTFGPDLMNSPAPFVYGDGSPAGDGGERTGMKCLSSLNLWGMAELYRWIPSGEWEPTGGSDSPPADVPYTWYCPSS